MKKINILPLAEKINADDIYRTAPVKDGFKIKIPPIVYLIIFVVTIISFFVFVPLFFFLFGSAFFLAGLDSSGNIEHNGVKVENNAWNRLPFLIVGALICSLSVVITLSNIHNIGRNSTYDTSSANIVIVLFVLAVALIIVGRFIYLVAAAFAISSRKKHCTHPIYIEDDMLSFYETDPSQDDGSDFGLSAYKYTYEGESYRITDRENILSFFRDQPDFQVLIDPDKPERYYSPYLFTQNAKKLKSFLMKMLFFLLFTIPFWIFPLFRYLVDNNIL